MTGATGPAVGRDFGPRATALVRDHALGRQRIGLTVLTPDPRARRAHGKCGLGVEGRRDALRADRGRHDELKTAVLSTDPREG